MIKMNSLRAIILAVPLALTYCQSKEPVKSEYRAGSAVLATPKFGRLELLDLDEDGHVDFIRDDNAGSSSCAVWVSKAYKDSDQVRLCPKYEVLTSKLWDQATIMLRNQRELTYALDKLWHERKSERK